MYLRIYYSFTQNGLFHRGKVCHRSAENNISGVIKNKQISVYNAVVAAQFSPQNSSVQNVHSHALPSYLVPFDPRRQYKVCEQILRGVAGGISPG